MTERIGKKILIEKLPDLTIPHKAFLAYGFQFLILFLLFVFFWWISSFVWYGALIGISILSFFATFPLIVFTRNIEKIRDKYRKKYKDLAYQKIWYRYFIYIVPASYSSLWFIILLKTDYFLPAVISLPENFMTISILPIYFALSLGIIITIFGFLVGRPSGGFDVDIDCYIYLVYPEESRKIEGGFYQFIRHPRYLSRGLVGLGLAVIANCWIAIGCAIIETEINYLLAVYGIIVGLPVISYYLFISSFDIEKDKEANVETSCTKLGFNNTIRVGIALYFIGFVLSIIFLGLFSILTISFIVCSPLISALVIKNKNIFKMLITASYFFWTGTILIMLFIFSFSLIPIRVFLPLFFIMIQDVLLFQFLLPIQL